MLNWRPNDQVSSSLQSRWLSFYSDAITHLFNAFQVFTSMLVFKSPMRVQISKSWWQTWMRKKNFSKALKPRPFLPFKRNRLTNEMKCRGWEDDRCTLFTLCIKRVTVSSRWKLLSVNLWAYWNPPGMHDEWKVHHSTRETNVSWHICLGTCHLISHLILCFTCLHKHLMMTTT